MSLEEKEMASAPMGVFRERISQAREARGMTKTTLANLLQVTSASISNYESGRTPFPINKLTELARYLRQPEEFFLTRPRPRTRLPLFRSLVSSKRDQAFVVRRWEWLGEVSAVVDRYVALPAVNLPDPMVRSCVTERGLADEIERLANATRALWGLGEQPILDLTFTAERNGFIVRRIAFEPEHIDGVGDVDDDLARPIVILNAAKECLVRSRFDLAHEIGHILLHSRMSEQDLQALGPKSIEAEANRYAGALLLPAEAYAREAYGARTLKDFLPLKVRWRVSVKALLFRSKQLGLVGDVDYVRLMKQYSKRGWHANEPFDSEWEPESPTLMREAAELLAAHVEQLRGELVSLDAQDLAQLLGTDAFSGRSELGVALKETSANNGARVSGKHLN